MRLLRNLGACVLLLCLVHAISPAQHQKQDAGTAAKKASTAKPPQIPLIGADDGLAVIGAALDARHQPSAKFDCSHLVHDVYERAGFAYEYASSSDLYDGNSEFRRVTHPQPGDLIAWPGHVGIVISPVQHSFYSALSTGLGVDAYNSDYWKTRGRPRFLRFVKKAATAPAGNSKTPSLLTATLKTKPGVRPGDSGTEGDDTAEARSTPEDKDTITLSIPRSSTIESARPDSEQVSESLVQAFNQTAQALKGKNVFSLSKPLIAVSRFEVQQVKLKGDQGWADIRISESASLASGQSNLKKRQEKQRWVLRRRDSESWEIVLPQAALYLNQSGAVQVLTHQLAAMAEATDGPPSNPRQKAQLAQLLNALLGGN